MKEIVKFSSIFVSIEFNMYLNTLYIYKLIHFVAIYNWFGVIVYLCLVNWEINGLYFITLSCTVLILICLTDS